MPTLLLENPRKDGKLENRNILTQMALTKKMRLLSQIQYKGFEYALNSTVSDDDRQYVLKFQHASDNELEKEHDNLTKKLGSIKTGITR